MPAIAKAEMEAVKTLAIAVGLREAARQTGLSEDRVRKWSSRHQWFKPTPKLPCQGQVTTVTEPSVALQNSLEDDSKRTRIGFSKAARKVAEHLAKASPRALSDKDTAGAAKSWTGVAATIHGWQEGNSTVVNVALLSTNGGMD